MYGGTRAGGVNATSTMEYNPRSTWTGKGSGRTGPEQRLKTGGWLLAVMSVLAILSLIHVWMMGAWQGNKGRLNRGGAVLDVRTTTCKSAIAADFTIQCCAEGPSDTVQLTAVATDIGGLDSSGGFTFNDATLPSESFGDVPQAREHGKQHVLVTGGAGYIGSHAALRLLEDGHAVTIVDNLSRGNRGSIDALMQVAAPKQLRFVLLDLGDANRVNNLFISSAFDVVIHFAAVAYVAESYKNPLLYYRNVTFNTQNVLEGMRAGGVTKIVYSSTCATYGNPDKMPITESTVQSPVSPYGTSKLTAERMIQEYTASNEDFSAIVLRYFNVIGSDPLGRIGEFPTAEIANKHGRISGACFNAALGKLDSLSIMGTDHKTKDGTCVRDYIHVVDLVDAHVLALNAFRKSAVRVYNVGIGKGYSVREFVNACIKVTGVNITVLEQDRRPGDASIVYADPRKVKMELGWEPHFVDLELSLATAWNWTSQHPHGY
eukprot:m.23758 g.23758  ORF g.23758 m.23758 type:complete len:489 (-) comp4101_c0_seq1:2239-3705(-)